MTTKDSPPPSLAELLDLRGQTAVVTGGATGIGFAIATRLAEAGSDVVVADVDESAAIRAAAEIPNSTAVHLDVASEDSMAALGPISPSIWVNNAGVYPLNPLLEMKSTEWDRLIAVNLRGTFLGTQLAAKRMVEAGRGGVIVNLSSIAGFRGGVAGSSHYVASKHAVRGFTKQAALELAPHAIRVVCVAPGTIVTPGLRAVLGQASTGSSPIGRGGVPDDVARVVVFSVSGMASFITGSTIVVDGGRTAH